MDHQSLVQYARHHKLTRDYQEISPISLINLPPETLVGSQAPFSVLELLDALPEGFKPYELKEQRLLTHECTKLLSSTLKLKNQETIASKRFEAPAFGQSREFKLEEPLLVYHENSISSQPPTATINLPYEPVQVEQDEGLQWSSKSIAEADKLWTSIRTEKLEVDSDDVEYMRRMIQKPKVDSMSELAEFRKNSAYDYITPPLSPCTLPSKLKLPDIVIDLPPLEDSDDNFELANWLTEEILRGDQISDHGEVLSYVQIPEVTPSPPKRRYSPLHIEVPLTPPTTSLHKRVKISEIANMMPSSPCVTRFPSEQRVDDQLETLQSVLKPMANKFLMGLQQEQLQAQDELRIPVPIMDFSPAKTGQLQNVEWLENVEDFMGSFAGKMWEVSKIKELTDIGWKVWHGDISMFLQESLSDDVEDGSEIDILLNSIESKDIDNKSSIIEGPINKNRDDDIEILEDIQRVPKNDLSSLVKRRKQVLDEKSKTNLELRVSSGISNQLSSFLLLQNQTIKSKDSSSVAKIQASCPIVDETYVIPVPTIDTSKLVPYQFIVSTTMLEHRALYRVIRSIYKNAVFVERDFIQNDILPSMGHNGIDYSQSLLPSSTDHLEEADIIVSPTTGMIITSLQKVRHRPLPGAQENASTLRTRIAKLAKKYDVLLVVVNTGNIILSTADNKAMASLAAFGQTLSTAQMVSVQDAGNDLEMATWIVCLLERYSFVESLCNDGKTNLLLFEKESLWELFLRKAGLNAFAAQVVLHILRNNNPSQGLAELFSLEIDHMRTMLMNVVGSKTVTKLEQIKSFKWE